jgi:(2Fe-2S) ferredoxin
MDKPTVGSYRRHLLICVGPRCTQAGASQALFDSLGEKLKTSGLDTGVLRVKRSRVHCFSVCRGGPLLCIQPDGVWYYDVTPENLERIVSQHLLGGHPVDDLIFHRGPGATDG